MSLICSDPATQLQMQMFDGARADLTKSLSMNPLFQVTHSFALGSQTLPSSYNFGAVFANTNVCQVRVEATAMLILTHPQVFLQGSVDHDGNVNARFNHGWSEKHVSKVQAQVSLALTILGPQIDGASSSRSRPGKICFRWNMITRAWIST